MPVAPVAAHCRRLLFRRCITRWRLLRHCATTGHTMSDNKYNIKIINVTIIKNYAHFYPLTSTYMLESHKLSIPVEFLLEEDHEHSKRKIVDYQVENLEERHESNAQQCAQSSAQV
jgi:hypothetical protein